MSEDTKDNLKIFGWVLLIIVSAVGFIYCFVGLITWKEDQLKKQAEEGCTNVAKIANVTEYKTDGDNNCILLKDDKLIIVKNW